MQWEEIRRGEGRRGRRLNRKADGDGWARDIMDRGGMRETKRVDL